MLKKYLPVALLILNGLIISGLGLMFGTKINQNNAQVAAVVAATTNEADFAQPAQVSPFNNIEIGARAAIVLDIQTGEIIYAKNIRDRMPLASITKVMTALVAKNLIPLENNTLITLTPEDLQTEGDSGLGAGETWQLKDLIDFSLIVSSNDGASAMAGVAGSVSQKNFVESMNEQAKALGLEQMLFKNETGLDLPNEGGVGAQGSAEDIARLFAYIYSNKPEILAATNRQTASIKPTNNNPHFITNTNEAIGEIPGLLASKTGYTDLSGGNLAVIFDRGLNQPAVAVVLGSTQQGRFSDIIKLTRASIEDLAIRLTTNQTP